MLVKKGPKCAWLNVATVTVCVKQVKVIFKFWEVLQTQIWKKVLQTQTQKIVTKVEKNSKLEESDKSASNSNSEDSDKSGKKLKLRRK